MPTTKDVRLAAKVFSEPSREVERRQDALSVSEDLAREVPQATTVLAAMIGINHQAVPTRWRSNHEDMRMILRMVGHREVAGLHGQQEIPRRGPEFPGLTERIEEIKQLAEDLQ